MAIKAVFDILMLYGFNTFTDGAAQITGEELIQCLTAYVTDEAEDPEMCGLVVEGFAKLFLMNQCDDKQMLSNLILLFFSPSTHDDVRLRQCLSLFFPTFAFASHEHQELCASIVVPTLRRVLLGPPDSQLKQIDWTKFARFLVHLADPSFGHYDWEWDKSAPSWMEEITLAIAYEMRAPEEGHLKMWARVLNIMPQRSPVVENDLEATKMREHYMMKTLMALKDGAEKICTDKQALKWIQKWTTKLDGVMTDNRTRDLQLEPDDITEIYNEIVVELKEYEDTRVQEINDDPIVLLRHAPATVLVETPQPRAKKGRTKRGAPKAGPAPKESVSKWGMVLKKTAKKPKPSPVVTKRKSDPPAVIVEVEGEEDEQQEKRVRLSDEGENVEMQQVANGV